MPTLKTKLFLWTVRNRHLMKFQLQPEVVTEDYDLNKMRAENITGAQKFGSIPAGIRVIPVDIAGMHAEWIEPEGTTREKVIFYTHGGGYVSGCCDDHRMHVAKLVEGTGASVLLFDYRLAPEHSAPAAMEDTLKAYRWMLAQGIRPENTVIAGESAGGGLCLAALVAIRDSGLPLPVAGVASSPWIDLTCSADSYTRNARRDISTLGSWEVWNKFYAGENDLRDPWISPIYADLHGLPPILIQVGTDEIMLDDAVKFGEKARRTGVDAVVKIWDGMVHCFAFFSPLFPEAQAGMQELCDYIRLHLGIVD